MIDFANKAIVLDNRLFNFRTLRTQHKPQYYQDYQNLYLRSQHHPQELTSSDPKPMELDATQRFRVRDRTEEEKWRRNNECYCCGKTGRYVASCPTKRLNQDWKPYRATGVMLEEVPTEDGAGKEDPQE
jgi:hypothetical protein